MSANHEKPSDADVVKALEALGGVASGQTLYERLMSTDPTFAPRQTWLAIQRACDREYICYDREFNFQLVMAEAA